MAGLCVMEQTVVPSCVPGLFSASSACERFRRSFTACADSCALRSTCPGEGQPLEPHLRTPDSLTTPVGGFAAADVVELKLTMTCACADAERV